MDRSDPGSLLFRRGPIDGRKFFSRSPFRSGYFLAATVVCLVGAILTFYIMYRNWQHLSTFASSFLAYVAFGIVGAWVRAHRYLDRVRQLYLEGSVTDVQAGSPLDIALGVAAGVTNDVLFFCSTTIVLLLVYVYRLSTGL